MLIYILKMIACSAIFYGLYALLFRNEKMLVFNRFYLLAALVISFVIPVITFTVYVSDNAGYVAMRPIKEPDSWINDVMIVLTAISMAGSVFLLLRFIKNLLSLKDRFNKKQEILNFKGARIILLKEPVLPHSFLNTIFLNSDQYHGAHIEKEVLEHELTHVKQKHSWDILFVELLHIFCWFNPFIYLYKRSVKINHELLADAAVVKQLGDVRSYQVVLLQRATAQSSLALASSFNFSTIKKRMTMLHKKSNPAITGLKAMLCLPLLVLLVFIFSERVYAQVPPPPPKPPQLKTTSKGKPADVDVFTVKTKRGNNSEATIKYKNGQEVNGDVSTPEKKKAFEKKYGVELPPPPPPAPPTRKKKIAAPPPPQPHPAVVKVKAPLPPPAAPLPPKKAKIVPPPAPPKPKKSEQVVSFTTPVIVKDKKTNEASAKHQELGVAARKQVKRLAPLLS